MADDLVLIEFGAWNDPIWFDETTAPATLVAAGTNNDLNIGTGIGGSMTGDGAADSLTVAEPFPGFGEIAFDGTVSVATFLLSPSSPDDTGPGLDIAGGALVASSQLEIGAGATLEVDDGGVLDSSGAPGLQDFGEIDVNDGGIVAGQLAIYGTLDLIGGDGTIATLVVGSYSGEGGPGGIGVLTIEDGNTIAVSDALVVAEQTGTGTIDVDGGTLTDGGDADVGFADTGALIVTAGGSTTVDGTLDIGTATDGVGTLSLDGSGSTLSAGDALIVGDAGNGTATISDSASVGVGGTLIVGATGSGTLAVATGASVGFQDALIVGDTGTGTISIGPGASVGTLGVGTIEIAAAGGTGSVGVSGAGASLNGAVLAVGGSGSAAGGNGMLSIGAGAVADAGTATVWSTGTVVLSGGELTASQITVDGGASGFGTLNGVLLDNGTVGLPGGALIVTGPVGGTGALAFEGVATLVLGAPGTVGIAQPVTGLTDGDRIELAGLSIASAATTAPGTITVALSSGGTWLFTEASFAAGASHALTTGHDTTTGDDYVQVACFAVGTRIAAARGEVAVEDLRAGDRVVLAGGGSAEAIWIGRWEIDTRRHPDPRAVWPVRIAADTFGPGRPGRDLFLSPDHAVRFGGVLIPAKRLIDGDAIAQVPADRVTYYHIELKNHDVLLAEGLPVESYLDTGDRARFDPGRVPVRANPDFPGLRREAFGCAPLVVSGPSLDAARFMLAAMAARRSHLGREPGRPHA